MSFYTNFKQEWNGRRVDYDHVYAYQCVDLIVLYCNRLGVNEVWGNAIDYANNPSTNFAKNFTRVRDYREGDIVVLKGLSGNPYGHIGIVDTNNNMMLEQNRLGGGTGTGGNAIGVYRNIDKSRVVAIWRKNTPATPPPAPAPARQTVTLKDPTWRLYRIGSALRPNTSDQIATLAPARYGGLTYKIEGWVGNYAVIIQTQMFGRGVVWVKDTSAIITK